MWPRIVEMMLGFWLAASPFIFRHDPAHAALWYNDFVCAFLVVLLSLASFSESLRHSHFATVAVGLWLMGWGYVSGAAPAFQNDLITGLVLVMLAIIPNEATQPPRSWRAMSTDR
jgi:glycerol uptake facilitator-like aquaporin